jgi:hypothetical protein
MLNGGEMLSLEGRRRRGHIWSLQQPRRIGFGRMSLRTVAGALVRRRGIAVPRVLLHEPLMPRAERGKVNFYQVSSAYSSAFSQV